MDLSKELHKAALIPNLELLARQIVEGYISGIHKSPFHGFSAEFAEHAIYNTGESTKHIDWKLFARTDKLYTKKYEEETNLRCHMILDNSASMYYPEMVAPVLENLNKMGFAALAIAALMELLKKQRDAVGLSVFSDNYHYYAPDKGSERHRQMLLDKLGEMVNAPKPGKQTEIYTYLHQIAEKIKRRSLVFLFTDLWQTGQDDEKLFEALRHLKYNRHEVVVFHLLDRDTEVSFNFGSGPKRFLDVETGEYIDLYSDNVKEAYERKVNEFFQHIKLQCARYRIKYVEIDVGESFAKVLNTFMIERQQFG
ncbi:DUF58 domain-containing protein [Zeaxanthinibacter enoshimensis]|uniref:Uncharacterized protein DUF58 n=1 Tax=Zeaxanthinibacter enoshimensis TaxID=392009 RepID=A0A4R6TQ51_9FLAO|nr:DUF58 domain-containing protein [Zeaxanthinibacter enoshimensis]TDQ32407.1 uncharacterized protein DUF58 [Zeaxanthinibacter enoshimensis]